MNDRPREKFSAFIFHESLKSYYYTNLIVRIVIGLLPPIFLLNWGGGVSEVRVIVDASAETRAPSHYERVG